MLVQVCYFANWALFEFKLDLSYFLVFQVDKYRKKTCLAVLDTKRVHRTGDAVAWRAEVDDLVAQILRWLFIIISLCDQSSRHSKIYVNKADDIGCIQSSEVFPVSFYDVQKCCLFSLLKSVRELYYISRRQRAVWLELKERNVHAFVWESFTDKIHFKINLMARQNPPP